MSEILRYTKIFAEDLDLGEGFKETRLQDSRVVLLRQIHLGLLVPFTTVTLVTSDGAAVLTATGALPAGKRIMGVTVKILQSFGGTNGLTHLGVGDATAPTRWGNAISPAARTVTSEADFADGTMPIYATATDLLVLPIGGSFDATGQIQLQIHTMGLVHH